MTHVESNPPSWLPGSRWFGKSETLNKTRPSSLFYRVATLPKRGWKKIVSLKKRNLESTTPSSWPGLSVLLLLSHSALSHSLHSHSQHFVRPDDPLGLNLSHLFLFSLLPQFILLVCSPLCQVTPVYLMQSFSLSVFFFFLPLRWCFLSFSSGHQWTLMRWRTIVSQDSNVRKGIML